MKWSSQTVIRRTVDQQFSLLLYCKSWMKRVMNNLMKSESVAVALMLGLIADELQLGIQESADEDESRRQVNV
ncbi:hypothetical protein JOB18_037573 [Solea senegalensis]|uniref:Uncharacterized protein n=1 Tax=Solea senegalensis TaxID=28829 RepID=A0AAV6RHB2_SOLSE|nr:hypothetical protein JOB18_037573 [Solea senegalensis]